MNFLILLWILILMLPMHGALFLGLLLQNRKKRIILHNIWVIEREIRAKKRRR